MLLIVSQTLETAVNVLFKCSEQQNAKTWPVLLPHSDYTQHEHTEIGNFWTLEAGPSEEHMNAACVTISRSVYWSNVPQCSLVVVDFLPFEYQHPFSLYL